MNDGLLTEVFHALDVCGLERKTADEFAPIGPVPEWFRELTAGAAEEGGSFHLRGSFDYLDHFLDEAEEFWARGDHGTHCSGPWTETTADGDAVMLEAQAVLSPTGQRAVLIRHEDAALKQQRSVLQKARERALEHSSYRRAVEKKNVLLHCIVHDLKTPLASIVQGTSLLGDMGGLSGEQRRVLELCTRSANKQEALIRSVLENFASDLRALEEFEFDPSQAPNLLSVAREAVQEAAPLFSAKKVELRFDSQLSPRKRWKVVAEEDLLLRVFANLLENALRYSAADEEVVVRLVEAGDRLRAEVLDNGPGVPPTLVPTLFDKFSRARENPGSSGLGLFICRQSIERWGGQLGYETLPEGGALFWFELLRA